MSVITQRPGATLKKLLALVPDRFAGTVVAVCDPGTIAAHCESLVAHHKDPEIDIVPSWLDTTPGSLHGARNEFDAGFIDLAQVRLGPGAFALVRLPRKVRQEISEAMKFSGSRDRSVTNGRGDGVPEHSDGAGADRLAARLSQAWAGKASFWTEKDRFGVHVRSNLRDGLPQQ